MLLFFRRRTRYASHMRANAGSLYARSFPIFVVAVVQMVYVSS